jgi:methionyl-tRNA synthetase
MTPAKQDRTPFYVTTPIYYVNSAPHLGHAFSIIVCDVLARAHRAAGHPTWFLTGTDEHGQNIQERAAAEGIAPREFVDRNARVFRETWPKLAITNDDFIRTTEERHVKVVNAVLTRVFESGDIYLGEYSGLYCVQCERFYAEDELVEGRCPDHGTEPVPVKEPNYLFRLEKYREWLAGHIRAKGDFIRPERYRNEVLALLSKPVGDLSISRPRSRISWGIPLPFDPEHTTYVWFDALLNYVSALGGPGEERFETFWPRAWHQIGKDIIKPHGVFWPAMLKAAGLPLYEGLVVSGYWLVDQAKMSKTRGNVVRPLDLIDKYGLDALRYFLIREGAYGQDASFSELALVERVNADLANDSGNLLHRTLGLIRQNFEGRIPAAGPEAAAEAALREHAARVPGAFLSALRDLDFNGAIERVLELVRAANTYIDRQAPWKLARDPAGRERLGTVLRTAAEVVRVAVLCISPVIPGKAAEALSQLGLEPDLDLALDRAGEWPGLTDGAPTNPGEPLFPRVDVKALKAELAAGNPAATPAPAPGANGGDLVSIDDFARIRLIAARVIEAEAVPKSDRLLKLTLDDGSGTPRIVASGIARFYRPEELVGRSVVLVANLKPSRIRGIDSQGMILAAQHGDQLALVTLGQDLPPGSEVR